MSLPRRPSNARMDAIRDAIGADDGRIARACPSLALHQIVEDEGAKDLMNLSGVDKHTIARLGGERADTFNGVGRVLAACEALKFPEPLRIVNGVAGLLTFRLPDMSAPGDAAVMHSLSEDIREFGEFASSIAEACEDREITAREIERAEREGNEAIASIRATLELMRMRAKKGPRKAGGKTTRGRAKR